MTFEDEYRLHWKSWLHNYFFKGKTIAIYVLMLITSDSALGMIMHRSDLLYFIPYFIMVIAYYAVFTDLVAHLYFDSYRSGLTMKQYVYKILHGRTHDIYGMIITIAMEAYLLLVSYNPVLYLLMFCSIAVITNLSISRFYH